MELCSIPWNDTRDPGEGALRSSLEAEGFVVHTWRDPSDRIYAAHSHDCDETLWVVRGTIVFDVGGREFPLGPGDRLLLPAGVVHCAKAGPDGASYLIGQRRECDDASLSRAICLRSAAASTRNAGSSASGA